MNQNQRKKDNFGAEPTFPQRAPSSQPPPPSYSPNRAAATQQASKMALWGMILAISGVVITFIPLLNLLVFLVIPTALVLSIIGLREVNKKGKTGKGQAITGLVVCLAWLVVAIVATAFFGFFIFRGFFSKTPEEQYSLFVQLELEDSLSERQRYPTYEELFGGSKEFQETVKSVTSAYADTEFKKTVPDKTLATESFYSGSYSEAAPIDAGDALPNVNNMHIWIGYSCKSALSIDQLVGANQNYNPDYFSKDGLSYAVVYKVAGDETDSAYRCQSSLAKTFFG